MSTNVMLGEGHTPSDSLTSISLLIYRTRSGQPELLVRSKPSDSIPTYSTPYRDLDRGQNVINCAQRIGVDSLGILIPEDSLDYQMSAVITNLGEAVRIRVFAVQATSQMQDIARCDTWRGWKYEFIPVSSLDCVYLHPDIGATTAPLRELVRTPRGH
ncbi:hypothetical protein F4824DRAFT_499782 [Ustulina deusta]|nr:hypothetical protein F4824DRAFT_499782 [Ustulina deusta]